MDKSKASNADSMNLSGIASGRVIPPNIQMQILKEEAAAEKEAERDKRELRRFIITTIIGAIAAIASIVAATSSVIACLS